MPPSASHGVPSSYAFNSHVPGHAPLPVHSISTAPAMITEGRVRAPTASILNTSTQHTRVLWDEIYEFSPW